MAATHDDRFTFRHSRHLCGVTALSAVMRDFSYERHAHEEFALGVTLAGRQDFFCRGAYHSSRPGNVIVFNPEDVHDGSPGERSTLRYAMLYIRAGELASLLRPGGPAASLPRIRGTMFRDNALRLHILALTGLLFEDGGSRIEQEWRLYEIAKRLEGRMGGLQAEPVARGREARFGEVREYVHEHIDRDLSIDRLCAVANMSKFHFIRLFRSHFGITPHKYVLSCRINRARAALEAGSTPTDTAHTFGFADVSHLNRRFKRTYGVTPKQYQLQYQDRPLPC